ncbi:MAG: YjbQ family protein [Leptotrichiaceae bacterium]|nr:YjbQ family protein [Leptotrichiaceae bacterium]MBP6281771.1 YjbQ family protein [Leptotrichiaceae bacterium]MBP7101000.1 YjbQ family protein [Leptotrichiaceae bacterium]MBP9630349.1 YjbQ family protein [Leptotrichiaceae bacterium]
MKYMHQDIIVKTVSNRVSYHCVTEETEEIIKESGVKDGIVVLSSSHTTCSLFFEEYMHDKNYYGDEYIQVDINNIMEKVVPKCNTETQYFSPGPEHIEFGLGLSDPNYPQEKWTMLNTDAHIKSSIFGNNSLTFIIKSGKIILGSLGKIYFVDWDQLRERKRKINVLIMGD